MMKRVMLIAGFCFLAGCGGESSKPAAGTGDAAATEPMSLNPLKELGRQREIENRKYAAQNLSGILKSANAYASDSGDDFPIVKPPATMPVDMKEALQREFGQRDPSLMVPTTHTGK